MRLNKTHESKIKKGHCFSVDYQKGETTKMKQIRMWNGCAKFLIRKTDVDI